LTAARAAGTIAPTIDRCLPPAVTTAAHETPSAGRCDVRNGKLLLNVLAVTVACVVGLGVARAQDKPRSGGELVFLVPSEPPSYDGHREGTFGVVHPLAPHYNTLLRIDPFDKSGTRPVPDLAESWTISPDGLTYTLKLRQGVRFHDGSVMTSRDVKASYDKIVFPPAGITSYRKGQYRAVEAIEAPDPQTIRFRLKWAESSFLTTLASPYSWIYRADILAKNMNWYERNVMGTGPFRFVEHVKGSHWVGKKNPDYWDKGKPYLDGYRALFVSSSSAQVAAIRGERAHIQFRGFSPADRDSLVQALGPKITVQESPWDCVLLVAMNHERKPWDDRRVRRALTLALDRYEASRSLSRIAIVKEVAGIQVPGTPWATPPQELEKLAGYGRDIAANRAEARRLLQEAGIPANFSFTLKNRGVPQPYEPVGIWMVDQWRQVGITVKQEVIEASAYHPMLMRGDFDVAMDFQCGFVVEPDLDIDKFQSIGVSDRNFGRYKDPVLDDLYVKQSRAADPEERKRHLRAFEKRLLDEEAHYIYTLQWHRIIPHSSKVRGWTITPAHFLNNQLDTVWLAE
jgi:peptide/nickel transport system substrate-binding protein